MLKKTAYRLYLIFPPNKREIYLTYYKYIKNWWFLKNTISRILRIFILRKKIKNFRFLEQKFYSQNGEDGILDAIFKKIGTTNRFAVEFGFHIHEANTLYLKKKGWNTLWMDGGGDGEIIKKEYITAENINELFTKYNVPKEPDLVSIDIDSNDYWVWEALTLFNPRAVVVEYNASVPPEIACTVSYDKNLTWDGSNYFGASLAALEKCGKKKGYTLITCDRSGSNAFFVRKEFAEENFSVLPIEKIYKPPMYGEKINGKRIGHPPSEKKMISV